MSTNIIVASVPGSVELWMLPPYIKKSRKGIAKYFLSEKRYSFFTTVISKHDEELKSSIGLLNYLGDPVNEHIPLYTPIYQWQADTTIPIAREVFISCCCYEGEVHNKEAVLNAIKKDNKYQQTLNKLDTVIGHTATGTFIQNLNTDISAVGAKYMHQYVAREVVTITNSFNIPQRTINFPSIDTATIATSEIELKFELLISDLIK